MEIKELEGTHQQLGQGQQLGQQTILSSLHLNSLHPSLLFLKMANKMALNINIPKLWINLTANIFKMLNVIIKMLLRIKLLVKSK